MRAIDADLAAGLVPEAERDSTLVLLKATQRCQGMAALAQPWPGAGLPELACAYVLCTEDEVIPVARQQALAALLGVTPIRIASPHGVFAARPEALAAILHRLAEAAAPFTAS